MIDGHSAAAEGSKRIHTGGGSGDAVGAAAKDDDEYTDDGTRAHGTAQPPHKTNHTDEPPDPWKKAAEARFGTSPTDDDKSTHRCGSTTEQERSGRNNATDGDRDTGQKGKRTRDEVNNTRTAKAKPATVAVPMQTRTMCSPAGITPLTRLSISLPVTSYTFKLTTSSVLSE